MLEFSVVTVVFAVLTVPVFYPMSVHPTEILFDRWDSCLHTYILAWDVHKLTTGLKGLFDANIFYPHPRALAYSDHLLGSALLAAPFLLATGNPLLAQNMVGYLSFVLSGLGMYLLVRKFLPGKGPALIAGLVFAFCPWRIGQLGHQTQLLTGQWMPFALLFLHKSFESRGWRDVFLFGLFFTLQVLCSFYLAALVGVASAVVFIIESAYRRWRLSKGLWIKFAVVIGLFSVLFIIPMMYPYYQVREEQGLVRTEGESIQLSADILDYLTPPVWSRVWGNLLHARFISRFSPFKTENILFPGLIAVLCAGVGFLRMSVGVSKTTSNLGSESRVRAEMRLGVELEREQMIYFVLAVTAFILSFGPQLHIFWKLTPIPLPYKLLYHLVPGFKALRVPARFVYLFMLALAVLAGYGWRNIENRVRLRTVRFLLFLAVGGGIFAESLSKDLPHEWFPTGDKIPPVYKWLAQQPKDFPVTELPQYTDFDSAPQGLFDPLGFTYMYYSIFHNFQPTTNGRSGFIPPAYYILIWKTLMRFPSAESVNLLRYLGVKYVVLHTAEYPGERGMEIARYADEARVDIRLAAQFGSDRVYEVKNPFPTDARKSLKGLKITDVKMVRKASPKTETDIEIYFSNVGEMPVLSFKLVDVEVNVIERGSRRSKSSTVNARTHIALMPGESHRISAQIKTPPWHGKYTYDVTVKLPDFPYIVYDARFDMEIGDYPDSTNPRYLKAEFIKISEIPPLKVGEEFTIEVVVKNIGDTIWRAKPRRGSYYGVVLLGLKSWYLPDKTPLPVQPKIERGEMANSVLPGEEITIRMKAYAPFFPGRYFVKLDMVDEHIIWFEDAGSTPIWLPVEVTQE